MQAESLQTLLELAQARSDSAALTVGSHCTREHSEEQKLQMLVNYRIDYQKGYLRAVQGGVSPASLANYQEFMKKLDLAVKQQAEVVSHWRSQVVVARQDWEQERKRVKSFDTLSQRQAQARQQREDRIEQRNQDEYAARLFARVHSQD